MSKAKESLEARIERRKAEIEYLFKRISEMETAIRNHTERISHLSQLNRRDQREQEKEHGDQGT